MNASLIVHSAGPGVSIQDGGRPGFLAVGLSRGGAADRLALLEAAALLGHETADAAAIEMAGFGGIFEATGAMRIALTGAPMRARLNGEAIAWHASHGLQAGDMLDIGGPLSGLFGYLSLGGGIDTPPVLGSRSTHGVARIGRNIRAGDRIPSGEDTHLESVGQRLEPRPRFTGGTVRFVEGPQTALFDEESRDRFVNTAFTRDPRGNRQGVRLVFDGRRFAVKGQLDIVSEIISPGDIQVPGDGSPFVLMPECQTIGGYPRIGTIVPDDLAIVAQAAPGTRLRFHLVDPVAALADYRRQRREEADLRYKVEPLIRDPAAMRDLLGYQLISGATAGDDPG
ncbi:MAG: biotin-dependent carboxyltransferase family protein [Geminicoccaceae bacterium]